MITPVNNTSHAQTVAAPKASTQPTARQQTAQTKPQAPSDTVQISTAAQQIIKESVETSVQTAKEAAGGDAQARRLLAREAADHAPVK